MVRIRVVVLACGLAACGRVGFDVADDAEVRAADATVDAAVIEVPDLVARYPMDGLGAGTVPANLAAYAGSCTMCPVVVADGARDGAYRFDGTQWLDLPAISETFVGTAPFTITLWIRTTEINTDRGVVAQPARLFSLQLDVIGANRDVLRAQILGEDAADLAVADDADAP